MILRLCLCVILLLKVTEASDITAQVFGNVRDGLPAAFGDFNSDELTDVFMLRGKKRTLQVFLAADEEPFLRPSNLRCNFSRTITSVVPGDFDGDAFMDVLVTTGENGAARDQYVYVLWGGLDHLNCTNKPLFKMIGQPLAIDYNQDMIVDLFGIDSEKQRTFWIFNSTRANPDQIQMMGFNTANHLRRPHSNAFLDLDHDHTADLFITGKEHFEIWRGLEEGAGYELVESFSVTLPTGGTPIHIGQAIFIDLELHGKQELLIPVCKDSMCSGSSLLLRIPNGWHDLQLSFRDPTGEQWTWPKPDPSTPYREAITVRAGDYNMDGYVDLIATLQTADNIKYRSFLLENVPCTKSSLACGNLTTRTFEVRWEPLATSTQKVATATFFDWYADGVLDVLAMFDNGTVGAYRNSLDYDANFVKVMVLTGLSHQGAASTVIGRLGKRKRRTYGTNLPGPTIQYRTTTQEGDERHGSSAQLPQSAHNSLGLPFTIFGLGRTPNFVDSLTVELSGHERCWTQIIPNSQMVVIPWPVKEPQRWRAQLFVTPSKLILMSVAALTAVCGVITVTIAALYWRERQEDRKERLQESHRFHFDAM